MKIITLLFVLFALSCQNSDKKEDNDPKKSKETTNETSEEERTPCDPYFEYDEVIHYFIEMKEDEFHDLVMKDRLTSKEKLLLEIIEDRVPETMKDTTVIDKLKNIGYTSQKIPTKRLSSLDRIFCERFHSELVGYKCIPIYRDILVFKKQQQTIGIAKICFECDKNHIIGTDKNTEAFGQSGDYKRLYKVLYPSDGVE